MIKLHQAKLSDTFDVLHVLNTALEKKLTYGDNAWGIDKFTTSDVLPYVELGEMYIVIASDDVVGAVALQESDGNIWGLDGQDNRALYIHKLASLQKGLGAEMIEAAGLMAKKMSKTYLRLDCQYENTKLLKYYKHKGFKVVRQVEIEGSKTTLLQKDI